MPNTALCLKNIYFGKVDAKNELLENTVEQRNNFCSTFLLPSNLNVDAFRKGKRYFVYGLKGTGKTAFLRYLSIIFEDNYRYLTSFILFKSEFGEEDKQGFVKAAKIFLDQKQFDQIEDEQDFVCVWKWFFYRHIIEFVETQDIQLFEHDDNWKGFKKHVKALKLDSSKTGLSRFIPRIKRGEVELEIGWGKLGLDLDFLQEHDDKVKFSQIVQVAERYFERLFPVGPNFYIFLDELELAYQTKKAYVRDARLIRDIIIVTNKINSLCRAKGYPVYIITSVRSEVLTAIEASGKEINKVIEDFGMLVSWHQAGWR